jgi:outer membrane protein assembly factor BamB
MPRQILSMLAVTLCCAMRLQAGEHETAKKILELSGIHAGLCVHLGAGSAQFPELTAELAASGEGRLLVHGLSLDDSALLVVRKSLVAQRVAGHAMVEKLSGKALPYLRDLADLIVVDDMQMLGKQGIAHEEILRVLSPGGVLCSREGSEWKKFIKPRPEGMGEWTHPQHGADGNAVSEDKVFRLPIGLRWIDGLPMNINRWASCRGSVVAGGRLFTLSTNQVENLTQPQKLHYLSAQDAWNGLPLWKVNCETTDDGAFLSWVNTAPLATDGQCVYVAGKTNAIGLDAASGKVTATFTTKYAPARLVLIDSILIASSWQTKETSKADFDNMNLWAPWVAQSGAGAVEAFDAKTGQLKWSFNSPALTVLAADGTVYLLLQTGNPPTAREVVALDVATGKERWRAPHTRFTDDRDLQLSTAGKGYVVVAKRGDASGLGAPKRDGQKPREKAVYVLAAKDGSVLTTIKPATSVWTPVVDGLLWQGAKKYDPLSGEVKGNIGWGLAEQYCTPQTIVNGYLLRPRGGQYVELATGKNLIYGGARGACVEGMVAGNGMLYTAQNNCRCSAGQVYGFLAVGPCDSSPQAADFEQVRPLEKGTASGARDKSDPAASDWPTYRHDAQRSAASPESLPTKLKALWSVRIGHDENCALAGVWRARLSSQVTAPTVADGKVFIGSTDEGCLHALDAASGKEVWSVALGGRLDAPPTIHRGLCLIGCHDGWLYALNAGDGQLAWRTRVAPLDKRMVAYGAVESVWPAIGTVLVHDNIAYANAGRSSESDGGVAVLAVDTATGVQVWGKGIGAGPQRQNDLLSIQDGNVAWWHMRLDPKTGKSAASADGRLDQSQGGILDGTWTSVGKRRSGNASRVGRIAADLLSWNDKLVVAPAFAVTPEHTTLAPAANAKEAPKIETVPKPGEYTWKPALPAGAQVEALALAANVAVYAGRITNTPKAKGFVCLISLLDGSKSAEISLEQPPTYDGIAIAGGKVYVSLLDGSVICLGN